jgi:glycosyltransferase involved in cell wall biosynthesis
MRALVYDQYLNALGGGERYALAFAQAIASSSEVEVAGPVVPDDADMRRLGLSSPTPLRRIGIREFRRASRDYDLTFQVSNYRPLPSRAARSIVLVQFPHGPFYWKRPIRYRPRRWRADEVYVTYSEFSRSWCETRWGVDATVIAPPVELGSVDLALTAKRRRILSVGRFFKGRHDKRFDVLVDAFAGLPEEIRNRWELVLAGGTRDRSAQAVLDGLTARSRGLAVRLVTDPRGQDLGELFSTSTLYWQATGFERPARHPEGAEHFGIALVEAMSHGCVPLAYRDGGAPEILEPVGPGALWGTIDELRDLTVAAIEDELWREQRAEAGVAVAARYSYAAFESLVYDLMRARFGI